MAVQIIQRTNGKYAEITKGDVSDPKSLKGNFSVHCAIRKASDSGAGYVLSYTDEDKKTLAEAGGQRTKHGWTDGGQCFAFEK